MDGAVPSEILPVAEKVFGDRLPAATRFAELLVTDGVVRGLIGPREAPRIWERHLLNCAVVADLIPSGASVVDVGSGAGLPGMVLAVARPDLSVTLVEPLARRTAFLSEAVTALGLERTTVVRARAEECVGKLALADVVTARAVAPLDRLAGWCLPLTAIGGHLLAMKGASAAAEVAEHAEVLTKLGAGTASVRTCGDAILAEPTTVVDIVREREGVRVRKAGAAREREAARTRDAGDVRQREGARPRKSGGRRGR
nr:16S rRNA (guanine(527)-N(7))-methyltransferase RsmG [Dactylosporangium thailandense]